MDLNKVMLIGRMTRDPELKTIPNGTSVTNISIATNFVFTDQSGVKQEKVEFHDIVLWRKLAEIVAQYLRKGSKIYIEGRLQTRSWDDPSGNKRFKTEIVGENMIMLDSRGSGGGATQGGDQFGAAPAPIPAPEGPPMDNEQFGAPTPTPVASRAPKPAPNQEEDLPTIDISDETKNKDDEEEVSVEDIPF